MTELFPPPGEGIAAKIDGIRTELAEVEAAAIEAADAADALSNAQRDLAKVKGWPCCNHCGEPFEPRKKTGGKPKKYCSEECRRAFKPNAGQRGPTPAQRETLAAIPQPKPAPEATDDEIGWCWSLPYQARIEVARTTEDEIEIEEYSPLHSDENTRIVVARSNAVRLARSILWAAGFRGVLIAEGGKGGYHDLEDGSLPEHFKD